MLSQIGGKQPRKRYEVDLRPRHMRRSVCTYTSTDRQRDTHMHIHTHKGGEGESELENSFHVSLRASPKKLKEEIAQRRLKQTVAGGCLLVCLYLSLGLSIPVSFPSPSHYPPFECLLCAGTTRTRHSSLHPFNAGINISTR